MAGIEQQTRFGLVELGIELLQPSLELRATEIRRRDHILEPEILQRRGDGGGIALGIGEEADALVARVADDQGNSGSACGFAGHG